MPFTSGNVEVLDRIVIGDSKCHWRGGRVTKVSVLSFGLAGAKQDPYP